MDCIFCNIAQGNIPVTRLYEDEHVVVFPDINPQAPVHVLIVPKRHIVNVLELDDPALSHAMLKAAAQVAQSQGIAESGFRLVTNVGVDGGQTVPHLHWHLLGGRSMVWPPG